MTPCDRSTSFARLSSTEAKGVLLCLIATASFFVAVTLSPLRSGFADAPDRGPGDIALYRAEIDRIHAGESYYAAAADELRFRGYPTRSLFNWRTPLPMWLLGVLPDIHLGQAMLVAIALAAWLLGFGLLGDQLGRRSAPLGSLAMSGAVLPCLLGDLFVMTELWAGMLLGLSAVAYGSEHRKLGFGAALAALFVRELSALWCLLCLALDLYERRWRSAATWAVGLAAYGVFYAVHIAAVLPLIRAGDIAHPQGWVRFGGAGFLISTAQMNAYLLLLPQWVSALYLAAALLGAAGWSSAAGRRIGWGIALYAVAFSFVGQAFNQYWGSLTAPLLCLAFGAFPAALGDLGRAAFGRRPAIALSAVDRRPG